MAPCEMCGEVECNTEIQRVCGDCAWELFHPDDEPPAEDQW